MNRQMQALALAGKCGVFGASGLVAAPPRRGRRRSRPGPAGRSGRCRRSRRPSARGTRGAMMRPGHGEGSNRTRLGGLDGLARIRSVLIRPIRSSRVPLIRGTRTRSNSAPPGRTPPARCRGPRKATPRLRASSSRGGRHSASSNARRTWAAGSAPASRRSRAAKWPACSLVKAPLRNVSACGAVVETGRASQLDVVSGASSSSSSGTASDALDEDVDAAASLLALVRLAPAVAGPRLPFQHRPRQRRVDARARAAAGSAGR